jgi:hypothetical protein
MQVTARGLRNEASIYESLPSGSITVEDQLTRFVRARNSIIYLFIISSQRNGENVALFLTLLPLSYHINIISLTRTSL